MELTIVIPIDMRLRGYEILKKIISLTQKAKNQNYNVILGCHAEPFFYTQIIRKIISKTKNIKIFFSNQKEINLSHLRNIAINQVKTKYILFMDIDIFINNQQINQTYLDVTQNSNQLCMYPCLYLSKTGNHYLKKFSLTDYKKAYYDFRRDLILHLAFPSSIIITDLASVKIINGFDESFLGHGYEDFDFMIRLFHEKKLIDYQASLMIDETYLAPIMATGFRAILASTQLDQLLKNEYFVHIYHKKNKNNLYHKQRKANQQRFAIKLKQQIDENLTTIDPAPPYLLKEFYQVLDQQQLKRSQFSVLWAEIQGHYLRR